MPTPILVVDVQPAYHGWCGSLVRNIADTLNATRRTPISFCWVGQGITNDTEDEVKWYLRDNGVRKGIIENALFIEKDYGFLRDWMDGGVDHAVILETLRHMRANGIHDSDDISAHDMADLLMANSEIGASSPGRILSGGCWDDRRVDRLLSSEHLRICGGGEDECLLEMELWLQSHNVVTERLEHLVY